MSGIVDATQRSTAIDPLRSFCVSAPAGSGKTELLIQRFLALLCRVQRPEQILAITFTRKAAAEMRERVMEALHAARLGDACSTAHEQVTRELAQQVLAADERGGWHLLRDNARLNIRTIDSFCAWLTRHMPVLSQTGGQATAQDDAEELYAEAVLELYQLLEADHPVAADLAALLLHFDNNWERLHDLLVSMLHRREQWRSYVGVHSSPQESEAYLVAAVESLVSEHLAQAQQLLRPYANEILELLQYSAVNLGVTAPTEFPGEHPRDLPAWLQVRNLFLTKTGTWRKSITKREGFPTGKGEPERRKAQLKALLEELPERDDMHRALLVINSLPSIEPGSTSWQLVLHLSRLLPVLAAQLLLVFQRRAQVDHSQIAQSALQALGSDDEPTELALRLDYQIEHILIDEFQDTAINQFELIYKLTRGWGEYNEQNPLSPRTLLIVGDGMQSIYGFRGANVGLFLKARDEGFNGVALQHLELCSNFRSDAGVVDWVNNAFQQAFPEQNDINRSQVKFSCATSVRPVHHVQPVACHGFLGDTNRQQEVDYICEYIAGLLAQGDQGSIAVLGRNRSHLQPIIKCLKKRGIAYNAPDLDSLAQSPLVADLMTLCRALANEADRLAWLALLRAPWCGLQLADLLIVATRGASPPHSSVWSDLHSATVQEALSADAGSRLQSVMPVLQQARDKRDRLSLRAWIEQAWLGLAGPACAVDSAALLDVESFLQLLEEAEATGVGLDINWLSRQLARRYMNAGDPDSPLHLMTLHKAKGLEFDNVIIPALDRGTRPDDRAILRWDEYTSATGERRFYLAADDHSADGDSTLYNYLKLQSQQKSLLEATRLLYVGATRAVRQLLLTASLKWDEKNDAPLAPAQRSLLSPIWPVFEPQMTLHDDKPATGSVVDSDSSERPLVRLTTQVLARKPLPALSVTGELTPQNVPAPPTNVVDRSIGNVVHLAMEELSQMSELPDAIGKLEQQRWRMALQREGLWGKELQGAWHRVEASVLKTLQEQGSGRWVLAAHKQAHSEWALTVADAEGRTGDLVIDRCFVDSSTGERWIVDYKTSQPLPEESLVDFTQRESATYLDQLLRLSRCGEKNYLRTTSLCTVFYGTGASTPTPGTGFTGKGPTGRPMIPQDKSIRRIVILTGAGVSAESGLATFRDSDGLWEQHDPMEIATPQAFARDPELVYRFYNARRQQLATVQPNAAHVALAKLQREYCGEVFLVTQNVDDLHERGGSEQVCHMHGKLNSHLCQACGKAMPAHADYDAKSSCPQCKVTGKLRPDIVWFGEIPYHMELIMQQLRACDLFIAVGTSGVVYPAAGFVQEALQGGATTIEVNREVSEVTGLFHQQRQGVATIEVAALVEELLTT